MTFYRFIALILLVLPAPSYSQPRFQKCLDDIKILASDGRRDQIEVAETREKIEETLGPIPNE